MSISQNFDYTPEETAEEKQARENRLRAAEISRRFAVIDKTRIRPLAAIVAGVGTDEDKAKLAALEREAEQLRAELAEMEATS